jgi:AraC-like DNA-binding protein
VARTDPNNRARYWADRRMQGLSLLHADFTRHDYAPHRHDALVVAVTELGGAEFSSRGRSDEARPDVMMVFNPDEPHSGRMGRSARWRYRSLYLDSCALDGLKAGLGIDALPYFTRNLFTDRDLVAGFLALHRALDVGEDAGETMLAGFGALFRRHGSGDRRALAVPRDRVLLDRVVARMRDCLAENLSLADLGAAAGLTPFQLIALFKRGTGMTPHAYLTQFRLDRAMEHLAAGRPIAETALRVGFCDQSALQRHFKRVHGFTPLQYAQARAA